MFLHRNIHKYNWSSPDGKTHNYIDHILIDVRSFRRDDCVTDHNLAVANLREILAVSKQAAQKFDGAIFNIRKLNNLEVRKQYQIKITNGFVALENLSDSEDINMSLEKIKENIKTSAEGSLGLQEMKPLKPWFYEECLRC